MCLLLSLAFARSLTNAMCVSMCAASFALQLQVSAPPDNGTTYYYTVSAVYTGGPDAGGESANSVQVSATPQGGTPTPPAPPTGLNTRSNRPGTVNLQWVESPTPGVTSNGVYRRLMNGGTYPTSSTYTINANTSFGDSQVSRGGELLL